MRKGHLHIGMSAHSGDGRKHKYKSTSVFFIKTNKSKLDCSTWEPTWPGGRKALQHLLPLYPSLSDLGLYPQTLLRASLFERPPRYPHPKLLFSRCPSQPLPWPELALHPLGSASLTCLRSRQYQVLPQDKHQQGKWTKVGNAEVRMEIKKLLKNEVLCPSTLFLTTACESTTISK